MTPNYQGERGWYHKYIVPKMFFPVRGTMARGAEGVTSNLRLRNEHCRGMREAALCGSAEYTRQGTDTTRLASSLPRVIRLTDNRCNGLKIELQRD